MTLVNRTPREDHYDAVRSTVVHLSIRLLPPVNSPPADHIFPATIADETRLRDLVGFFYEPLEKF